MNGNFTLFRPNSNSSASGSSSYVQDVFEDVSLEASNNTGLTSSSSTNPLGGSFANGDTPEYSLKTLTVKDAVLIEDRSKWIDNKPTYQIVFNEQTPGVLAYTFGAIRLRNQANGVCINVNNIGDGIGITGKIRKVLWGVNCRENTGTAAKYTDGASLGANITFGSASTSTQNNGVNTYSFLSHQTTLDTEDLHDFQIRANQFNNLSFNGIQIYYLNSSSDIECNPGVTYIDKTRASTSVATQLSLPSISSRLGAVTKLVKSQSGIYSLTTSETQELQTAGTGSSGAILINVTTGEGASFPAGSGLVGVNGTSFYIGSVVSVSTDTLTVNPALDFDFNGLIYKSWQAGPTAVIGASLYEISKSVDILTQNNYNNDSGFVKTPTGDYYYSAQDYSYRLWGNQLEALSIQGYPGIGFNGFTAAVLNFEFYGSAAEIEMLGNGILQATFAINGVPAFSIDEGFSGIIRRTLISDSGPAWHQVAITPGQSLSNVSFTKLNIYDRAIPGTTLGVLSEFQTPMTQATRYTHNATMMTVGGFNRIFADSIYVQGDNVVRGETHTVAGGVFYAGSTNTSSFQFNYFGNDFAIVGQIGSSYVFTFDGGNTSIAANALQQVAGSATFHSFTYQNHGGTFVLGAIDFNGPSLGEIKNTQNYLPREELRNIPKSFFQSQTPREAKDGDVWSKDVNSGVLYMRIGKRWLQLNVSATYDDPNAPDLLFIKSHGVTTQATASTAQANSEHFNFSSWSAGADDTLSRSGAAFGSAYLGTNHYFIDGVNTSDSPTLTNQVYDKTSWSSGNNRTNVKVVGSIAPYEGNLLCGRGYTGSTQSAVVDSYNGISWTDGIVTLGDARFNTAGAVQGGLWRTVAGTNTGAGASTEHDTWNGSSGGTDTAFPVTNITSVGTITASSNAIWGGTGTDAATGSYQFNGTAWSSEITMTYGPWFSNAITTGSDGPCGGGFNSNASISIINGGGASSAALATSATFDGTSWSASVNSSTSRACGMGAVF